MATATESIVPGRRAALLVLGFAAAAALASAAAPLLVYTVSLAAFGLPHVLAELRYVDARFSGRIGSRLGAGVLGLLGVLVALRLLGLAGWLLPGPRGTGEILVLAGLAALVFPALAAAGPGRAILGAALIAVALLGAVEAPATTLVVLAVLHNLTPLGFLAERLRGPDRRRALLLGVAVFGAIPAVLALGLPARLLGVLGIGTAEAMLPGAGSLSAHLGVFVPPAWLANPLAVHLFTAATFLQVMHYAVVLHVLPRLQREPVNPQATFVQWPGPRRFRSAVTTLGVLMFLGFAWSFGDARAIYGVFAAVHAWIEIPIFLLATAGAKSWSVPATPAQVRAWEAS